MAQDLKFEDEVHVADIRGSDQCDYLDDDGDGLLYWCPGTDKCCLHPASNVPARDGDWFCCDPSYLPVICVSDEGTCGNFQTIDIM